MAPRKTKPRPTPKPARKKPADTATDEAAILLPDRDLEITDPKTGKPVTVTVREFRFLDGLKVQAEARPLIEAMAALIDEDGGMTPARLGEVLGRHADLWIGICAVATGREAEWIARVREPEAGAFSMAVWQVNSGFFTARLLGQHRGRETLSAHWAWLTSSISSPPPDTGDPAT
ncbi:DUF6631 family protein [Ruegeria atlantica]|uniref:DUF6631 family protein n=1 Tax=Ruegeria atlantica TaxID=81569 RepID=UPI00147E72C1|nr:DUF6631 family protein [Ruegeria atlantica]